MSERNTGRIVTSTLDLLNTEPFTPAELLREYVEQQRKRA